MIELHKRKPLTKLQRAKLFRDRGGICGGCNIRIGVQELWIDEHVNPLAMGGTNDWSNRELRHVSCAKEKTKIDVAQIAKAKSIEARHIGAKPKSKWPKRFGRISNTKQLHEDFEE
jgi:hypothetical protein